MDPIFIFSLPRSGSTMLQRILMGHSKVQSTPETWVLFHYLQPFLEDGVMAKYSFKGSKKGLDFFINNMPGGEEAYKEKLRTHILDIYNSYCTQDQIYFLDKTPRYYYLIDEIVELFPKAKFIFLLRNPLAIYSSILETFCDGQFRYLARYYQDIYRGFELLSSGLKKYRQSSFVIKYEDLVSQPDVHMKKCLEYLELDEEPDLIKKIGQNTFKKNTMGDPVGQYQYHSLVRDIQFKWKKNLNGYIRKQHVKSFLEGIPDTAFEEQGYDKRELLEQLKNVKTRYVGIFNDLYGILAYKLILKYNLNLLSKTHSRLFYS